MAAVMNVGSFMHSPACLRAYAGVFQAGFQIPGKVFTLEQLVHWKVHMGLIGCLDFQVNRMPTSIFGGSIYNFSSPAPSQAAITEALDGMLQEGAKQCFVPTIRSLESCGPLLDAGFRGVSCFIESVCELDGGVDDVLATRVGGKRMREMRRLHRKAAEQYNLVLYSAADIQNDETLVRIAASLHGCNVEKYGLPSNFYNESVLRHLVRSEIQDKIRVGIRYRKSDKQPVQVLVLLLSPGTSELFFPVQGIARDHVAPDHNLYIASMYDVYRIAAQYDLRHVHLGRGNHAAKFHLGANKFYLLKHWIYSPDADVHRELAEIERRTTALLDVQGLPFHVE